MGYDDSQQVRKIDKCFERGLDVKSYTENWRGKIESASIH